MKAPIVVGVSPTSGSIAAVEWALSEARRSRRPLLAVAAWQLPRGANPGGVQPGAQAAAIDRLAEQAVAQLAKTVRALAGETSSVEQRVERGTPAAVLLRAAIGAELLVIGSPHPGEFSKLRATLLAPQLIYKSPCPVVVMPAETRDTEPTATHRIAGRLAGAAAAAGRPGLRLPSTPL